MPSGVAHQVQGWCSGQLLECVFRGVGQERAGWGQCVELIGRR